MIQAKNIIAGQTIVFKTGTEMEVYRVQLLPTGGVQISGWIPFLSMNWHTVAKCNKMYNVKQTIPANPVHFTENLVC